MKCDTCNENVAVYELTQRSYRLYVYFCGNCMKAFLAHHFDLELEIYQMQELGVKKTDGLVFLEGLKVEPRVFDFKVEAEKDSVVVADERIALGELTKYGNKYIFSSYSERAKKRLCRKLMDVGCMDWDDDTLAQEVARAWEEAK